mmetsp:Transcript_15084/g.35656  ORF Transcript_15084/g.35656 Transcript_15084/m.35656 type:complete len:305 (+) Transcript_15084:334-1248(+)
MKSILSDSISDWVGGTRISVGLAAGFSFQGTVEREPPMFASRRRAAFIAATVWASVGTESVAPQGHVLRAAYLDMSEPGMFDGVASRVSAATRPKCLSQGNGKSVHGLTKSSRFREGRHLARDEDNLVLLADGDPELAIGIAGHSATALCHGAANCNSRRSDLGSISARQHGTGSLRVAACGAHGARGNCTRLCRGHRLAAHDIQDGARRRLAWSCSGSGRAGPCAASHVAHGHGPPGAHGAHGFGLCLGRARGPPGRFSLRAHTSVQRGSSCTHTIRSRHRLLSLLNNRCRRCRRRRRGGWAG